MRRIEALSHRFVDAFPDALEAGVLYVAPDFATMSHLCCCGCGREVVTPLSPKDWKMTFDGKSVSVHPSIGSWSLPCRSHYVIRSGRIRWAGRWTEEQVRRGRDRDLIAKRGPTQIRTPVEMAINHRTSEATRETPDRKGTGVMGRLRRWLSR